MEFVALLILFAIIYRLFILFSNNRPTMGIILFASIFSPKITMGNLKIDGLYFVIAILVFLSIYKLNYKWIIPNKKTTLYLIVIFTIIVINYISWFIYNGNEKLSLVSSTYGLLKFMSLTYFTYVLNIKFNKEILLEDFKKFILLSLSVNAVAVVLEILNPTFMINFLSNAYLNQVQMEFFEMATIFGVFSRYYGLFSYPMNMGMFMAFVILYSSMSKIFNNKERAIILLSAFGMGIMSNSRSFIYGFAIALFLIIIMNYKSNIVVTFVEISGFVVVLSSISIFYDSILEYVRNNVSVVTAHYMESITQPELLLTSRLDSTSGSLVETMKVIQDHWILGVGPDSINGELVIDNAYLVLLHNGGIIALSIVLLYYTYLLYTYRNKSYYVSVLFLILCTAVGFPVLIGSNVTHWFLTICMLDET